MEDHFFELWHILFELLCLILVIEELGILKARNQHLTVALDDIFQALFVAVTYGEEVGQQMILVIHHREIPLMIHHRCNNHFRRQCQILLGHIANKDGRILHNEYDFVQQFFIVHRNAALFARQTI